MAADQALEGHAAGDLDLLPLADGSSSLPADRAASTPAAGLRSGGIGALSGVGASDACIGRSRPTDGQRRLERPEQQPGVEAEAEHAESLLLPLEQVLVARGEQAAVLARLANDVLHAQDLLGDARPFPLAAVARRRGEVRRAEEEQLDARRPGTVAATCVGRPDRLDDRHDQDMLVRLGRVLDQALPPAGRPLGADAAQPFVRIAGITRRPA